MTHQDDNAGVIAPPPLLALGVIVLGPLLDWLAPAYLLSLMLSLTERIMFPIILIGAGAAMGYAAIKAFRAAGTRVEPWKPTTAIVTTGVFAWMRNPMYVGGALILAGLSVALASDWMLALTFLLMPLMHYGVVKREERYLAAKFGQPYLDYMAQVSRYGWPF
ncbi:MAG: isoprenylcysteine carboxylmethyltransferase family protein [Pseudolabrys sp.]|nr:isoprenylcysteine carboxylmethyltransferase family protein [Pseudolabrys sp.]